MRSMFGGQEPYPRKWDAPKYRQDYWNMDGAPAVTAYAENMIAYYTYLVNTNHQRWRFWQFVTIGAASLSTALAAVPDAAFGSLLVLHWIRVIPPAVTTISAAIIGTLAYRSEATRQAGTRHALEAELMLFRSRGKPYDGDPREATAQLASSAKQLVNEEVQAWRASAEPKRTEH